MESGIPFVRLGILDPGDPLNPAADFDVGYVPYCDGSAMMGDAEVDSDGDGDADRFFRGVQNLSASLDVIAREYPEPRRIVLAGNSAGGFAVHAALPLVRRLYPDVRIDMVNDSGVGILDPGRWEMLSGYWNASGFLPESCTDCAGVDGNLTGLHRYQLEADDNTRLAYISSTQDATIAEALDGGGESLEAQLVEAVEELNAAYPRRFQSLIADGDEHTFIIRAFAQEIAGTTVREWVADMLGNDADWVSRSETGR